MHSSMYSPCRSDSPAGKTLGYVLFRVPPGTSLQEHPDLPARVAHMQKNMPESRIRFYHDHLPPGAPVPSSSFDSEAKRNPFRYSDQAAVPRSRKQRGSIVAKTGLYGIDRAKSSSTLLWRAHINETGKQKRGQSTQVTKNHRNINLGSKVPLLIAAMARDWEIRYRGLKRVAKFNFDNELLCILTCCASPSDPIPIPPPIVAMLQARLPPDQLNTMHSRCACLPAIPEFANLPLREKEPGLCCWYLQQPGVFAMLTEVEKTRVRMPTRKRRGRTGTRARTGARAAIPALASDVALTALAGYSGGSSRAGSAGMSLGLSPGPGPGPGPGPSCRDSAGEVHINSIQGLHSDSESNFGADPVAEPILMDAAAHAMMAASDAGAKPHYDIAVSASIGASGGPGGSASRHSVLMPELLNRSQSQSQSQHRASASARTAEHRHPGSAAQSLVSTPPVWELSDGTQIGGTIPSPKQESTHEYGRSAVGFEESHYEIDLASISRDSGASARATRAMHSFVTSTGHGDLSTGHDNSSADRYADNGSGHSTSGSLSLSGPGSLHIARPLVAVTR